jgi:RHS repeat-associated protein
MCQWRILLCGFRCERYTYDNNGNLLTRRARDGQSISFAYDLLNRLTGKTTPVAADRVAYSYDLLGRRLAATYPAGTAAAQEGNVANVYDKVGRLLSTASRGGKLLAYQYDPAGNRTRTTMPDGTALFVQYGYDSLNRVTSIKENGSVNLATYAYDDLSRRTAVTLGNGNVMSYGYNGDDTLASLGHNLQGAVATNDVTLGYGYNQVDQINSRTLSNAAYLWNGHYNVNRPYTANGLNQYATSGPKALSYDARGNLGGDGTWTFAYDVENRLLNATRSGLAASFAYDTVGRLATTTNAGVAAKYMYDGDDLVAEYNSANTLVRRYIHGPGIDEPLAWYEGAALATKRYFQADHQGSIIAVTDQAGAPISQFSYGPYGEPSSLTGSEFRYTGQRLVAGVGLYYYKARFYSPYLGRFLQTDPIGTADDMNMYAYVGSDPVNGIDPSGLKIVIVGSPEFKQAVESDLSKIRSQPGGETLIKKLEATPLINKIVPSSDGRNYARGSYGKSSGSTIEYNPRKNTGGQDSNGSNIRPPFVGLGHELGHARAYNLGKQVAPPAPSTIAPGTTPKSEIHSMANENMIRKEHGLPERPSYAPSAPQASVSGANSKAPESPFATGSNLASGPK